MPSRYGSLYDAYRLDNSRQIPIYTGSAAPEALQVGQYMQGLYNQAQSGAFGIGNGLQSLTSLPQDKALVDDLRNTTQARLQDMAKRGDYENMIPEVQALGSEVSNRYRELLAPMQQRTEFIKSLDEKDYNLTGDQKQGIIAMSDAGYTGLKKDEYGRLTGKYTGTKYDKNIDLNKWIDERMKDIAIQKGGSEVVNDNGVWKIKQGNKWEQLAPGTIESAISSAMANSADYLGYRNMMGRIAGFRAGQVGVDNLPDSITTVDAKGKPINIPNPTKQQIKEIAARYGIPLNQAAATFTQAATEKGIEANALNYARTKYAMNNRWTESGREIGQFQVEDYKQAQKEASSIGIFGDAVTGQGIDLAQKYGDANALAARISTSADAVGNAETYIDAQKNRIARAMGIKPAGSKQSWDMTGKIGVTPTNKYSKSDLDQITDRQVIEWYAKNDPQELARYQSQRNVLNGSREEITEMNQLRDAAMDAAVKAKTGGQQTYGQLREDVTKTFQQLVKDGKLIGLKSAASKLLPDAPYAKSTYSNAPITKDNVEDWEVIDGDRATIGNSTITVRNKKTGRSMEILQQGQLDKDTQQFRKLAGNFDGINWKDSYKNGIEGIRSNMTWLPLLNKTTPDGETTKSGAYATRAEGILSAAAGAGAIRLTDNNDSVLDKDDQTTYQSLIAAGQYKLLGIGIDPKTGGRRAMVNIVVDKDASDADKRFKTVLIGADSNIWDRIAGSVQNMASRELQSPNQAIKAAALKDLQLGMAMQSGSGFGTVSSLLPGQSRMIKDSKGNSQQQIVAAPTGDDSNALIYYIYKTNPDGTRTADVPLQFSNTMDLGAYIDMQRADGKIITK